MYLGYFVECPPDNKPRLHVTELCFARQEALQKVTDLFAEILEANQSSSPEADRDSEYAYQVTAGTPTATGAIEVRSAWRIYNLLRRVICLSTRESALAELQMLLVELEEHSPKA